MQRGNRVECLGLVVSNATAVILFVQRWAFLMLYIHKRCCYLTDEESIPSRDLNQWRGALTEHEQLLKRWEKAWVGLCSCMQVCFVQIS